MFRYNGEPAIGMAISMVKSGDVLTPGKNIKARLAQLTADLPIGIPLVLAITFVFMQLFGISLQRISGKRGPGHFPLN